ncbi:hypothetical protein [Actinomadura geliboluensis]|uniref:hypothetical protein n=1 Tax=Actinomadura geliboluensis TaxID=882440 RepID=UPI00369EC71E
MNPVDLTEYIALVALLVAFVLIGANARRTGAGLALAAMLTILGCAVAEDALWILQFLFGVASGIQAVQFGKELRKGGAK